MSLVKIFSVSMPRSGHHAVEMILRELLGDSFAYCEYYTIADCCKEIPCARMGIHDAHGAAVFMQKSHDQALADPVPKSVNGILIQVREPVARALSNYELGLKTVGPPHSPSYQTFWLGMEAAYTVGFLRKWREHRVERSLLLRYEDLLRDPVEYCRRLFAAFRISASYFNEAAIKRVIRTSSAGAFAFAARNPGESLHYDPTLLGAYAAIVAPEAAEAGYPELPDAARSVRDPAMTLVFQAFGHLYRGDVRAALADLDVYLARPDAHFCGRQQRAALLVRLGEKGQAEAELARVLSIAPDYMSAAIDLAALQQERGDEDAARTTLTRVFTGSKSPAKAFEQIPREFAHLKLTPPPGASSIGVERLSRDDVIAAFRFILGREPESEAVIENHRLANVEALRVVLLGSEEFRGKFSDLNERSA